MKKAVFIFAGALCLLMAWLVYALNDRPSLDLYADHWLASTEEEGAGLRVTFLGVSTLLFDDGETAILIDGFFTRPGLLQTLFTKIKPDTELITQGLARAGIGTLAAVIVVHSHYDHAMDAPEVAQQTGAILLGSESTANIGRGWGMAEERIRVVKDGETIRFDRFQVTMPRSRHFPHGMAMGNIEEPLQAPQRATAYLEGGSYSVLIQHDNSMLLVQSSAGFIEGALVRHSADIVFLGVGGLATLEQEYMESYWREVVLAVKARRVIPIHWDDFTRPLAQPLVPAPLLIDEFDVSMNFVLRRANEEGIDVKMLPEWVALDPFAGL
ncbi:MAG: MBL fold metallo-hydrolase [Pseudomonadales bacterium]